MIKENSDNTVEGATLRDTESALKKWVQVTFNFASESQYLPTRRRYAYVVLPPDNLLLRHPRTHPPNKPRSLLHPRPCHRPCPKYLISKLGEVDSKELSRRPSVHIFHGRADVDEARMGARLYFLGRTLKGATRERGLRIRFVDHFGEREPVGSYDTFWDRRDA
jgi:hypothetical protein